MNRMPNFSLVLADLAREHRLHEELEERVAAAADGEIGREHGHRLAVSAVELVSGAAPIVARCGRRLAHPRSRRRRAVSPAPGWPSPERVLELADRPRLARQRPAPAPPIGGDEAEQEDHRLAGHEQQGQGDDEQRGVSQSGQFASTPSGVRISRTTSTTSWNRKQPRPGPRSASSGAPLYTTPFPPGGVRVRRACRSVALARRRRSAGSRGDRVREVAVSRSRAASTGPARYHRGE